MSISTTSKKNLEVFTEGIKVWFPDQAEGWIQAQLKEKDLTEEYIKLSFIDDRGKNVLVEGTIEKLNKGEINLPPLCNPPILIGIDDLTNLSHLHEPAVLHNIHTRYNQHNIYTYSGIVLIAINPFQKVSLYSQDIIETYSGKSRGELEPHLFAIAEDAYQGMKNESLNQTIIVSGESGAGKTVSAKYIMRYFAFVNDSTHKGQRINESEMSEIEQQILATNPILESFGNAKTTRNDNSSRFGKFIEIQFDPKARIVGAQIRTYLLERSRLIYQPSSERNYHIFYQLCTGAPSSERKRLHLEDLNSFHYLNQGGEASIRGVDDAADFESTQKALSTVGISVETQWHIFRILAGLLHMGNIRIGGSDRSGAMVYEDDTALHHTIELLGLNSLEFQKWLVRKQIITRSEKIVSNIKADQAIIVRDSVAKYIYSNLFDWLVSIINTSLCTKDAAAMVQNFIGVLDIYGFEHFEQNSFEQFCINYANEKLQQQFNQHVFKLEQEEYAREQINWTFIEFTDNQPCIDMIESRMGILAILDEECRFPSATDQTFVDKLYQHFLNKHNYFSKPRFSNTAFTVRHYAHDVTYQADGFLDKNKDTVPEEMLAVLKNCDFDLLREILITAAQQMEQAAPVKSKRMSMIALKKNTLGHLFKGSLINLMDIISQTDKHYIRCIKPNEAKEPWSFEPQMVLSQLRACGVLETIRISCNGYPSRRSIDDFVDRYYMLIDSNLWSKDRHTFSENILHLTLQDPDKYQLGRSKVFFRAGQLAYLEKLRADKLYAVAVIIQRNVLRYLARSYFLRLKKSTIFCQSLVRRNIAMRELVLLKKIRAALLIQTQWRGYSERRQYQRTKRSITALQRLCRAHLAKLLYLHSKQVKAAIFIQKHIRGILARQYYQRQIKSVIFMQSCLRRRIARAQLKELKIEARDVKHFKEVSFKLENKLFELTLSLQQKEAENKHLLEKLTTLEIQHKSLKDKYDKSESRSKEEIESSIVQQDKLIKALDELRSERDSFSSQCSTFVDTIQSKDQEIKTLKQKLTQAQSSFDNEKKEMVNLRESLLSDIEDLKEQLETALHNQKIAEYNAEHVGEEPLNKERGRAKSIRKRNTFLPKFKPGDAKYKRATIASAEELNNDFNISRPDRPISQIVDVDIYQSFVDNQDLEAILQSDELIDEITDEVISKFNVPIPNFQMEHRRKELLFPAHITGYVVVKMYRFGYAAQMKKLLMNVITHIQKRTMAFEGDFISVFWLSNVFELLSILKTFMSENEAAQGFPDTAYAEAEVINEVMQYLESLLSDIYFGWVKELQKRFVKLIIPGVVESEALPGFTTNDSNFFNKLIGSSQSSIKIETVLNFFNNIWKTMVFYFVDDAIMQQIISELLNAIGVTGFNHIIMRKNFCSWKRGMQIQYNLTRIEEWCKEHGVPCESRHLEQFMQAVKLLQLQKSTIQDIDIMFEVCYLLNPAQIKKLMTIYATSDYENPVGPHILAEIARRSAVSEKSDSVFLDPNDLNDQVLYLTARNVPSVESYIPMNMSVRGLRALVMAS